MEISQEKLRELHGYITEEKWDYAERLIETFAIQHFSLHDHRFNMWVHYLAGITYLQRDHPVRSLIHLGTFWSLINNRIETNVYSKVHGVRPPTLEETDRCERLLEEAKRRAHTVLAKDAELKGDTAKIDKRITELQNAFVEPTGKTEGCFIVTACCGSTHASEVLVLSAFRDHVMRRNKVGRCAEAIYYALSPILANLVARRSRVRRICFCLVVYPFARSAAAAMRFLACPTQASYSDIRKT